LDGPALGEGNLPTFFIISLGIYHIAGDCSPDDSTPSRREFVRGINGENSRS
jgi:hypothetical protein